MKYPVMGLVLVALLAIPAAVAGATTGQVAVSGNIQSTCFITLSTTSLGFGDMVAGQDYTTGSGNVHVGCNVQPWTLTVLDDGSGSKPRGYLYNLTGAFPMALPFQIYNGTSWATLASAQPTLFARGTTIGGFDYPVQFFQHVSENDAPAVYQTTVTFTLTA